MSEDKTTNTFIPAAPGEDPEIEVAVEVLDDLLHLVEPDKRLEVLTKAVAKEEDAIEKRQAGILAWMPVREIRWLDDRQCGSAKCHPAVKSRRIAADNIRIRDCTGFPIGTEIAGAIYRQNLSEPDSCPVNPAFDGADRASANLCGLLVRKS
jgi:hypothetical protein